MAVPFACQGSSPEKCFWFMFAFYLELWERDTVLQELLVATLDLFVEPISCAESSSLIFYGSGVFLEFDLFGVSSLSKVFGIRCFGDAHEFYISFTDPLLILLTAESFDVLG